MTHLDPILKRQIAATLWANMDGLDKGNVPFDPATVVGFENLAEHERVWWLMVVALVVREYDAAAPSEVRH